MRILFHIRPFSSHLQNTLVTNNRARIVIPSRLIFKNITTNTNATLQTSKNNASTKFSASEKAMTRKPTSKCDPYQQNGKPLSLIDSNNLLETLHPEWKLLYRLHSSTGDYDDEKEDENEQTISMNQTSDQTTPPIALYREFSHEEYINGMHFLTQMSYVCMNQNHYPKSMSLHHSIDRSKRHVVSKIQLHTDLLRGLSFNDFHLATMMDVEIERDKVQSYLKL